MFQLASRYFQSGALHKAAAFCRDSLSASPRQPETLHLYGLVQARRGDAVAAIALIRQAIAAAPGNALFHFNLGCLLEAQGMLDEAVSAYARAAALQPDSALIHNNLGATLLALGRLEQAAASLGRALTLVPDMALALNNAGLLRLRRGEIAQAIPCFERAVARDSQFASARGNLAVALLRVGRFAPALAALDAALRLTPDDPALLVNRGLSLTELGRTAEAVASLRRALALAPDNFDALYNLGIALRLDGQPGAAITAYEAALAVRPEDADTLNNLGIAQAEAGQADAALANFRHALARADKPDARYNLATALLARGELAEGWRAFESRWQTAELGPARRSFTQPQWDGAPALGRTLLIHAEQGFGDTLQFCRYAPLAAAQGLHVVLEVPPALTRLCATLPGVREVVAQGTMLQAFDLHIPMMSLPLAFGTVLETIPCKTPYLWSDPLAQAAFSDRLLRDAGPGLRVGVVWAGNPRVQAIRAASTDRRRSIDPALLAPLWAVPGVRFVSLQKDGPPPPPGAPVLDWMGEMEDFADTAALIANLDLVIAVDTAVAHLAGALGKPVWLLNRFDSCWRWLTARRDSPWYPSLTLYTQPEAGAWAPVIAAVAADLRGLVERGWGRESAPFL